jgi:hypothetical protein
MNYGYHCFWDMKGVDFLNKFLADNVVSFPSPGFRLLYCS